MAFSNFRRDLKGRKMLNGDRNGYCVAKFWIMCIAFPWKPDKFIALTTWK